jgi:hypothetical protein
VNNAYNRVWHGLISASSGVLKRAIQHIRVYCAKISENPSSMGPRRFEVIVISRIRNFPLFIQLEGPLSYSQQEVLGRTDRLLSLIIQGPHWKRRVQQFFYCCVCIRHRGNVPTETLPSNDRGTFTEPLPSYDRGIFSEPLPSNDKGIFSEPLPSNNRGDFYGAVA